jgi:hypothetical protein
VRRWPLYQEESGRGGGRVATCINIVLTLASFSVQRAGHIPIYDRRPGRHQYHTATAHHSPGGGGGDGWPDPIIGGISN